MCIRDSHQIMQYPTVNDNENYKLLLKLNNDKYKDILNNLLPVSYTHLDVYKRQVLDNTIEIPVASRKQVDFHKYWFQYLKRR